MNNKKHHIKILQYMHGDLEYFHWSEKINRLYSSRHGYQYTIVDDPPRKDRHVCWHKIPVILQELNNCEYLLFMDADAVFYSHELTIGDELLSLMDDRLILMAQDCGAETRRWHPGLPNTGVILIKNHEVSRKIFEEWDKVTDTDKTTCWEWPPDQLGLWRHILPKYINDIKVVMDYYLVQGHLGQYIRHLSITDNSVRAANFRKIYLRLAASVD